MKKKVYLVLGILFFVIGALTIFISFSRITGYVIGGISGKYLGYVSGLVFILTGIFFLTLAQKTKDLEEIIGIRSKKELSHLSPKQRAFRKKLINLYENLYGHHEPINPNKIAYLLPQYDKVRNTGEYVQGHDFRVYMGRRGNREEYFSVDTEEIGRVRIGDETFLLPTHIDIQERIDKNYYKQIGKEPIPWSKLLMESRANDIIKYFKKKKERRAA